MRPITMSAPIAPSTTAQNGVLVAGTLEYTPGPVWICAGAAFGNETVPTH